MQISQQWWLKTMLSMLLGIPFVATATPTSYTYADVGSVNLDTTSGITLTSSSMSYQQTDEHLYPCYCKGALLVKVTTADQQCYVSAKCTNAKSFAGIHVEVFSSDPRSSGTKLTDTSLFALTNWDSSRLVFQYTTVWIRFSYSMDGSTYNTKYSNGVTVYVGNFAKENMPTAPTDVSASASLTNGIRISWSGDSEATSFNVWRGTSSVQADAAQIVTGKKSSPYTDTSEELVVGKKYYYWIEACNSVGSRFSPYDWGVKAVALKLEYKETSVDASGGNKSFEVKANTSWTAASKEPWIEIASSAGNGDARCEFAVAANGDANARTGTVVVTAGSGTPYPKTATNTVIQAGCASAPVTYAVNYDRAGGTAGRYAPTNAICGTAFRVSAPTKSGCTFEGWNVSSGLNSSTAKWGTGANPSTAISSSSTKCANGTNDVYFLDLRSNAGGVTLKANWTTNVVAPGAPTDLGATTTLTNGIRVSWTGGGGATSHNVWRGTTTTRSNAKRIKIGASSPFTDNDSALVAGTSFYYWIEATNPAGSTFSTSYATGKKAAPSPITYGIGYALDGGRQGTYTPTNAAYGTAFRVSAPSKSGCAFAGWSVSSGLDSSTAKWGTGANPTTAISGSGTKCANGTNEVYFLNLRSTAGGVTLKANWTLNSPVGTPVVLASGNGTGVELSWGETTNATGFVVWRARSQGGDRTRLSIPVTTLTQNIYNTIDGQTVLIVKHSYLATDTTAVPGQDYWYWVQATNETSEAYSGAVTGYRLVTLALSKTLRDFGEEADTDSLEVTANTSWTASKTQSWLTLSPAGASGSGTLGFSVTANPDEASRSDVITVTAGGATAHPVSKTVAVSQKGKEIPRPANDDYADATSLGNAASGWAGGDNTGATWEAGEPDIYHAQRANSVWWTWTAPATGVARFEILDEIVFQYGVVTSLQIGTGVMGVYTNGTPADISTLKEVGRDGGGDGLANQVWFNTTAGRKYWIAVAGDTRFSCGSMKLEWEQCVRVEFDGNGATSGSMGARTNVYKKATKLPTCGFEWPGHECDGWATSATGGVAYALNASPAFTNNTTLYAHWVSRPANDDYADATSIGNDASGLATGDNTGATREAGEPDIYHAQRANSVWWTWTAPATGVARFEILYDLADMYDEAVFDNGVLGVYTNGTPADISTLKEVESGAGGGDGLADRAWFNTAVGRKYWIAVAGATEFNCGSMTLEWRQYVRVEFDGNGATSGSMGARTNAYEVWMALPACGFDKTGWVCDGWATSATGPVAYALNASARFTNNTTLYAHWVEAPKPNLAFYRPRTPSPWPAAAFMTTGTNSLEAVETFSPTEPVCLRFAWLNNGEGDAGAYAISAVLKNATGTGISTQRWYSGGLTVADGCKSLSWEGIPVPGCGTYTMEVTLNAKNVLAESDFGDNTTNLAFTVGAPNLRGYKPKAWPAAIFLTGAQNSTNVVESVWTGETAYLRFCYGNFGEAAMGTHRVSAVVTNSGGRVVADGSWTNGGLAIYEIRPGILEVRVEEEGSYAAVVTLDPDGDIDESDESDNEIRLEFTAAAVRPANDDYSTAEDLGKTVAGSASGNNTGATWEEGEPSIYRGLHWLNTVWWTWTAPATGVARVDTAGSAGDFVLWVFTNGTPEDITSLVEMGSDLGGEYGREESRVWFNTAAGRTYWFAVAGDGAAGDGGPITLNWQQHVRVKFKGNGATSGSMGAQTNVYKTATSLPACGFERTGYECDGWATSATGTVAYALDASPAFTKNMTLYAHWKAATQTVLFDPNGGTCKTSSRTAVVGETYTKLASATREGYKFVGWYDAQEGGTRVKIGDPVPPQTERTLWARWEGLPQTVRFDANGGTCKTSSRTAVVGETYAKLASATREGYKFVGWYDAQEGGTRVRVGDTVTPQTERTLWARWEGRPQTVHFDANGGKCSKTTATYIVGEIYSGFKTATRNGFKFMGWYDAKDGGKRVKNGMTVTVDSERTLYARWQATAASLSITGFARTPRPVPAVRDARASATECTLQVSAPAGIPCEVQWTPVLGGEWTVLHRWTPAADGETSVPVVLPADSPAGFFRVVGADADE